MALRLDGKKTIVAEVAEVAKTATALVAANYSGLTVAEMTEMRKTARENGVYLRVVRNTLARRAFTDTAFSCMNDTLVGPLVLAFSKENPSAAARLMRDFAKRFEKLEIKALALEGAVLGSESLERVASLPTREEAVAQLMSVMLAPITKLVRTIAEPHSRLVRTFGAVRDKKQRA